MSDTERQRIRTDWSNEQIKVVCATITFGMGIDKCNVRFIFHHSIPNSLSAYAQQTGRADRDGQHAHCLLFFNDKDIYRNIHLIQSGENISDKYIKI